MIVKSLHTQGKSRSEQTGLLYPVHLPGQMQKDEAWEHLINCKLQVTVENIKTQMQYRYKSPLELRSFDQNASPELNWHKGVFLSR